MYWECVFKREYGKRIKGEHEKHKGEKTKITLADKKAKRNFTLLLLKAQNERIGRFLTQ